MTMQSELLIFGGIIFVLLILSGFFSGSETALTGTSKARMHQLAKQGDKRAELVLALLERKDELIQRYNPQRNLIHCIQ